MNIHYVYSLYDICVKSSKYWINYIIRKGVDNWKLQRKCGLVGFVDIMAQEGAYYWNDGLYGACVSGDLDLVNTMIGKGANDWDSGLQGAYLGGHIDIINMMLKKGAKPLKEYYILFKIPKDDKIIEIIYASLYDYLPDEMINEVLKYSIVEDFNLKEFLHEN